MKKETRRHIYLTYDEAAVLEFLAESFLYDHENDSMALGSRRREAFSWKVVKQLAHFTDINRRCGEIGPADSVGDRPRCNLPPHGDKNHRSLDIYTMQPLRWDGSKAKEYFSGLKGTAA